MKRQLVSLLFSCAIVCSIGAVASAQTDPPPASNPPPRAVVVSTSSNHGGGPFGVGGIAYLANPIGLSLAYDPGAWHLDTLIGINGANNQASVFDIGGRFWYHLASTSNADLSVGAGMTYEHRGRNGAANPPVNNLFLEAGGLIRIWLAQNVALGTAFGLVVRTADSNGYEIGPTNLVSNASIHYYF